MSSEVKEIFRYPVKGLTGERLDSVTLVPGECLPNDRRFGIAHGASANTVAQWQPKRGFVTLMQTEKLAKLETLFDDASGVLTIKRGGRQVVAGDITSQTGRTVVEQFLSAFLQDNVRGRAAMLDGGAGPEAVHYTDEDAAWISIIGLPSVRDLTRVVGKPVDSRRFRANLYLEGSRPWEELDWVGRTLRIGGVELVVKDRIQRCAATNVDPDTAQRDLNLPLSLQRGFRHCNMGVFAEVSVGGTIEPGSAVEIH